MAGPVQRRNLPFRTNPPSIRSPPAHTHSPCFTLLEISLKVKSLVLSSCVFCRIVHYHMKALEKALECLFRQQRCPLFSVYIKGGHLCHQLEVLQCNCFISWKIAVQFQKALWEDCSQLRHESPFIVFQAGAHGLWFECDSRDFRQKQQMCDGCCFWSCRWIKSLGCYSCVV